VQVWPYLSVGIALLACALVAVRVAERTWLSPASGVFLYWFFHCFPDAVYRAYTWHGDFNTHAWPQQSIFNITCFAALLLGYLALFRVRLSRDPRACLNERPATLFGRENFPVAAALCILVLAAMIGGMTYYGSFTLPRTYYEDGRPALFDFFLRFRVLALIFVSAIFVSAYSDRPQPMRNARHFALLLVAVVVVTDALTFGRMLSFSIILLTMLVAHFRIRRFTMRGVFGMAGFVLFLQAFSMLRRGRVAITRIDGDTIRQLVDEGRLSVESWLVYLLTSQGGQDVLSHVIPEIDATGLHYGWTYLNVVLSKTIPFYQPDVMPEEWYRVLRQAEYHSYGRDFSLLAEAYMNFGRFGFVVPFVIGAVLRWVSVSIFTTRGPVMLIWSALMIVNFCVMLRTHFVWLFTQTFLIIVPLVLFVCIFPARSGAGGRRLRPFAVRGFSRDAA